MKTIIATIACCLITAAATAQENYYKTDCEIRINQDTILLCHDWGERIMLEYKSDTPNTYFYQKGEKERMECEGISSYNYQFQDWDYIDSVMHAIFLDTFTDEQIKGFYANKYKLRTLFTFNFFYNGDGEIVKTNIVFDNTPNYTSVSPVVYANFINAFQKNFKLKFNNKQYPYYWSLYGFMVPSLDIIPTSTKK